MNAVNCDPWSVLKMPGVPVCSAASSASTQKLLSIVFDSRHDSTCRLAHQATANLETRGGRRAPPVDPASGGRGDKRA